ncbi:hypothetical protein NC651_007754 [Populus alba x Populus x berolinensis]|nr:hypothetical protein NC651_007754 [Populus alba x Populus x berolinensis]
MQSFGPDSYSRNPQLCGPPTLNTCKNIFATIDVAEDQNKESSPTEPPRKSSIPNSEKISVVFIAVGFVVAIFLFFLHFKKARKLIFIEEEAKSFTLNDLLKASAEGLGKGNFGDCYKAVMDGKEAVDRCKTNKGFEAIK